MKNQKVKAAAPKKTVETKTTPAKSQQTKKVEPAAEEVNQVPAPVATPVVDAPVEANINAPIKDGVFEDTPETSPEKLLSSFRSSEIGGVQPQLIPKDN